MDSENNFFERVYAVARLVPYGRVTTYGAIARYLGSGRSARMVGWAMNQSHASDVPAHRVINRHGMLTGKQHFGGSTVMQQLLESEGLHIEADAVKDFDKVYWDPTKELGGI